jgi:O-methyltransferase
MIEITRIAFCDPWGEELWSSEHRPERDLKVAGTAVLLPGAGTLILFSYGDDPQVLLPLPAEVAGTRAFLLEVDLTIDKDPAAIVPFLRQTSPWSSHRTEPQLTHAALDLFEQECAHLERFSLNAGKLSLPRASYLNLMKKCLTRFIFPDSRLDYDIASYKSFDPQARIQGSDWPTEAETMIGVRRLNNIQELAISVLRDKVPGDFVEAGVWRGGAAIFMKAILSAFEDQDRLVWVADSFEGLPSANPEAFPADMGDQHSKLKPYLGIPCDVVRANFRRYGLLDERVRFLEGYFKDTLHGSPVDQIAILRVDGDMYESTIQTLQALYPRVSSGGYVIVDDFGALPGCKKAVLDYRSEEKINNPIVEIDWTGIYWQRD